MIIKNASIGLAKQYTKGNVKYNVTIKHYYTIDPIGKFEVKNLRIKDIEFKKIPTTTGYIRTAHLLI